MIRLNELVDDLNNLSINIIIDSEDFDYAHNNPIIFKGKVFDFRPRYKEFYNYYVNSIWKSHEDNIDLDILVDED